MTCDCRFYGNQHGRYFRPCDVHMTLFEIAAKASGLSVDEWFNAVVLEHARRIAVKAGEALA